MKVYVPVNKVVERGRQFVIGPGLIIFFIFLIGIPIAVSQYTETIWILIVAIIIGFAIGFLLGTIYSSFAFVRWKIWAYENVQNLHELKEKAEKVNLISREGHWSEKFNFASNEQKQKLKILEKRFSQEDIYHDDLKVPKETEIYISKKAMLFMAAFGVWILGMAVYRYFHHAESNARYLMILSLPFLFMAFIDYRKKEPRIRINNIGIKLHDKEFMPWEFITDERVEMAKGYDNYRKYFIFNFKGKEEKLLLEQMNIKRDKLEHLLRVYRLRFNKNTTV